MTFKEYIERIKTAFKHYSKAEDITMHPKFGKAIEYKFSCGNKHYYKLLNVDEMFNNRAKFLIMFANESEMKIDKDSLIEFMDMIISSYEIKEGETMNVGVPFAIAQEIKYRCEWLFEPDALYRFASCVYFELQEDIRYFDWEYNKRKVELFKKKNMLNFFFTNLLTTSGDFATYSEFDFKTYSRELEKLKKQQKHHISNLKSITSK